MRDLADGLLATIERRVAALEAAGEDLSPFDAPEVAGIAGTTIGTDFSFELVRWLVARFPAARALDWDAGRRGRACGRAWPEFLPLLEEEALADANVPYLDVARRGGGAAPGRPRLAARPLRAAAGPPATAAERFDSLESPITWDLGDGSRPRVRGCGVPGPAAVLSRRAVSARRDVSLDAVMSRRRRSPSGGSRGGKASGSATGCARRRRRGTASSTRSRTPTRPRSSRRARGAASSSSSSGILPERRLPLRSAYGGFVVKNGVPIGYIEGLAFFERLEIGFNMYYTFREGESAWIYAQVLKLHRDALGVTSFSIDPYQLGYENEEALESGAFWFYRKLGFRPTSRERPGAGRPRGGAHRAGPRAPILARRL